jgi:hypothetical protein
LKTEFNFFILYRQVLANKTGDNFSFLISMDNSIKVIFFSLKSRLESVNCKLVVLI